MNTTESRPIGFLLRRLDRLIDERFDAALGRHGVTRRQWQLLNTLAAAPATIETLTAEVAPFLTDGETPATDLSPLIDSGAVQIRDGRYSITGTGRELLKTLAVEVHAIRDRSTAGLSPDDYARTVSTLNTMIKNLELSGYA